ncbi:MAG: SUMF1/EgtB/PvdO family nonheme iron enzyme [Chloroflexi bacterium]|nr:SUMF1/EgtB/PvdO family nonheme iron enzyme [Chloroflexota bacterium]
MVHLAYMSPEQWEGQPIDARSDIYSFGVLSYEMLTGDLPFKADTTTSMMFQHLHTYPPPIDSLREGMPAPVNEVVKRAIAKQRDERYGSASEFSTLLRRALHGRQIELSPLSPLPLQRYIAYGNDPDSSTMELPVVRTTSTRAAAQTQQSHPTEALNPPSRTPTILLVLLSLLVVFAVGMFLIVNSQSTNTPPEATANPTSALSSGQRLDGRSVLQVRVPQGCFSMGSDLQKDPDAGIDELPAHRVCVNGFWMDVYEVTHEAYAPFVEAGGYADPQWWSEAGWTWVQSNGFEGPEDRAGSSADLQPRINLSWYEADAYARWRGGRLPTEAEWEYAARGEAGRVFAWGDGYQLGYSIINEISRGGTAPTAPDLVGSRPTDLSWMGVYDVVGNACEWVADWFGRYEEGEQANPTGPETGTERVIRGGNFLSSPTTARLAVRTSRDPAQRARSCGVRVVTPG